MHQIIVALWIVALANLAGALMQGVHTYLYRKWRNEDRARIKPFEDAQLEGQRRANDIMAVQAEQGRLQVEQMRIQADAARRRGESVIASNDANEQDAPKVREWPKPAN